MSRRGWLLGCALAVTLAALSAGRAVAANWLEQNFYLSGPRYDGVLPPCDAEAALYKISSRFNMRENDFWNTDLQILGFEKIRETAFRPWAGNSIPRRYCSAHRPDLGWPPDGGPLFDRRRHRHDRHDLGRRVVHRRARPQLGLQPGLQDGAALIGPHADFRS